MCRLVQNVSLLISNDKFKLRSTLKMSIEDRAKAVAKNIEGKVQEAVGDVTGDSKDVVEGQSKQNQAAAMHAVEDVKDAAKDVIDKA
jgi:uncharacterized protein YjbJ (UPF0337 family)